MHHAAFVHDAHEIRLEGRHLAWSVKGGRCNTGRFPSQRTGWPMSASLLRALGLISGTSLDGIDVALIETDGERLSALGPYITVAYEKEVRQLVRLAFGAEQPTAATETAERAVTEAHVAAARQWSHESGIPLSTIDVVGFHGQTITHRPD